MNALNYGFELVLSASLVSTLLWLCALIGVRCCGLKKAPGLVHLIFLVVMLRFLVLATPPSPTSWMNWISAMKPSSPVSFSSEVREYGFRISQVEMPDPTPVEFVRKDALSVNGWSIVSRIWGAGFIYFVVLFLLRIRQSQQLVKRSHPIRSSIVIDTLQQAKAQLGVSQQINIRETTELEVPAVVGCFRSTVLLPHWCIKELTEQEMLVVLMHELVHIQRKDLCLSAVAQCVKAIHWFNPALVFLERSMVQLRELTCDDRVVKGLSKQSNSEAAVRLYGQTLLKITQKNSRHIRWNTGEVGVVGFCRQDTSLKERILMLKSHRVAKPFDVIVTAMVIVLIFAAGFTSAQEVESENQQGQKASGQVFNTPLLETRLPPLKPGERSEKVVKADVLTKIKIYEMTPAQLKAATKELNLDQQLREHDESILGKLSIEQIGAFENYCRQESVDVLSAPNLWSLNANTSEVLLGGEVPFAVVEDGTPTVEFRSFGMKIRVTTTLPTEKQPKNTVNVSFENTFLKMNETEKPGFYTRQIETGFLCDNQEGMLLGHIVRKPDEKFFINEESEKVFRLCVLSTRPTNANDAQIDPNEEVDLFRYRGSFEFVR